MPTLPNARLAGDQHHQNLICGSKQAQFGIKFYQQRYIFVPFIMPIPQPMKSKIPGACRFEASWQTLCSKHDPKCEKQYRWLHNAISN
jgi:hypothetical protein